MSKLVPSYPYEQLYFSYLKHILSIPKIFNQRPPLSESVNLTQERRIWWQRFYATYGGPDEIYQKTLYNYDRLASNYAYSICFKDASLRCLWALMRSFSHLTDAALCLSASVEDESWRNYCAEYARCLSKEEIKYRYLAVQKFLAQVHPIRPEVTAEYFERHIWGHLSKHYASGVPTAQPRSTPVSRSTSHKVDEFQKPISRPTRKEVKKPVVSAKPETTASTTEYDYDQIIAGLIKEGWLTLERVKRRRIVNLIEYARFIDCLYRSNQNQFFPEELIERLGKDYQLVSLIRLKDFLGPSPAHWISNAREWLK